ncbi:hypothetical protein M0804_009601 [Polistes exclamans]|nr:hypothetical protein M0804_009601 [Polistes exclamans]
MDFVVNGKWGLVDDKRFANNGEHTELPTGSVHLLHPTTMTTTTMTTTTMTTTTTTTTTDLTSGCTVSSIVFRLWFPNPRRLPAAGSATGAAGSAGAGAGVTGGTGGGGAALFLS